MTGRTGTRAWRIAAATAAGLFAAGMVGMAGALAFVLSGVYDIAASRPHLDFTQAVLTAVKRRSVEYHARNLEAPDLDDAGLIRRGFALYRQDCVPCHGAPGESRSRIGIGVNPNPPPLFDAAERWTTAEIAWITLYGLKMAGMPAFGLGESPRDIWALTAFVRRLNTLSPEEYRRMQAAERGEIAEAEAPWLPGEQGWDLLERRGDPARGRRLMGEYGCLACHIIDDRSASQSMAGPPLTRWRERHFIAGNLINNPLNLVRWLRHPQAVEPGTAMPDLDVGEEDAWAMARYLYSLDQAGSSMVPMFP